MGVLSKPTAHTDALVLRAWPCGETSCVASLLTRDEGYVKVLAKGVRRPGSRLRALVEPGRLVQVEFSLDPSRELQYLRGGAVSLDPLAAVASLERSAFLLGAVELVDRCRPLGQAAGHRAGVDLFAVCEEFVRVLSSPVCREPALLFFAFEWELLERHGMAPEIAACIGCGLEPDPGAAANLWFSPAEGGLVCEDCSRGGVAGKRPLGRQALELLRTFAARGLDLDAGETMPGLLRREVGASLHHFMGYHLPGYRLPAALELLRPAGGSRPAAGDTDTP